MGLRFEIRPTHVEEDDSGSAGPEQMVRENARLKAATLAGVEPDALVLGSDTTVAIDGLGCEPTGQLSAALLCTE